MRYRIQITVEDDTDSWNGETYEASIMRECDTEEIEQELLGAS